MVETDLEACSLDNHVRVDRGFANSTAQYSSTAVVRICLMTRGTCGSRFACALKRFAEPSLFELPTVERVCNVDLAFGVTAPVWALRRLLQAGSDVSLLTLHALFVSKVRRSVPVRTSTRTIAQTVVFYLDRDIW